MNRADHALGILDAILKPFGFHQCASHSKGDGKGILLGGNMRERERKNEKTSLE